MLSRLNGLEEGSSLSDVVVNHFDVILKGVVLAEEDILFEPGLAQIVIVDELAVTAFVVMPDELSLETGQNFFEYVGCILIEVL